MYVVTGYNQYSGIVETVEAKTAKDALQKVLKEKNIKGKIVKLTAQKNQEFLDKGIMPFTMIHFTVEKEDTASTGNYMVQ